MAMAKQSDGEDAATIGMGSGNRTLELKFTSAAKKKLKKAKSVKLGGTLVVADAVGNAATYTVKVALKK